MLCAARSALAQEAVPEAAAADDAAQPEAAPVAAPIQAAAHVVPIDYSAASESRTAGNYLWPLVDIVAINLTLWGIPYSLGQPFVQTNPSNWAYNFRTGPQWDDGEFEVNQLAHPIQGSLYFSAARVHGLSFWESVPYSLLGSSMWEYFLEVEQPSKSDFITTPWGGSFLGESLYRLSNAVLDDSTSGSGRFWREFAALAINPMNGLDRIVSGQAWAEGPPGKRFPLDVTLRLGVDGLGLPDSSGTGETFRAWIRFDYGDLYAQPQMSTPFEAFHLAVQVGASKSTIGEAIDGTGVLWGQRWEASARQTNLFAWVITFEYATNGTSKILTRDSAGVYQLGEMGTGAGWFSRWALGNGFSLDSELDALAVPSGAITSPYARYQSNRSYNYGVGGSLKAELNLRQERLGRLYVRGERHLYHVVDGAFGTERVGNFELGAYANLYRGHGLGLSAVHYDHSATYDDYPDFDAHFWSGRAHYELEF